MTKSVLFFCKHKISINLLMNYLPNLIFKDKGELFLHQQMIRWQEEDAILQISKELKTKRNQSVFPDNFKDRT